MLDGAATVVSHELGSLARCSDLRQAVIASCELRRDYVRS